MARTPLLARSQVLFAAAAVAFAACGPRNPEPDPGPSMPPRAAAAAHPDTLTAEDMEDQHVARAEQLLVGRFPGVEVLSLPGGGVSVRIRGQTSVSLSTEPLYVVDGVTIQNLPGGALTWLAPQDIQKIEVLKDAGSTAFWGVRGANGVILITTKH